MCNLIQYQLKVLKELRVITISQLAPKGHQIKITGKVQFADMPQVIDLAETIGKGSENVSLVCDAETACTIIDRVSAASIRRCRCVRVKPLPGWRWRC